MNIRAAAFAMVPILWIGAAAHAAILKDLVRHIEGTVDTPVSGIRDLSQAVPRVIEEAAQERAVDASDLIGTRTDQSARRLDDSTYVVPYTFASIVDEQPRAFAPVAILATGGFQYDATADTFAGRVLIGLRDLADAAANYPLQRPVQLTLTGSFTIEPQQLVLAQVNRGYSEVAVSTRSPDQPGALEIYSTFDDMPTAISLPVNRPVLRLSIAPRQVLGFGLEVADVRVAGNSLSRAQGRVINLENEGGGRLGSSRVDLDEDGQGHTTIRSTGIGQATVRATGLPYQEVKTTIEFVWPWLFLAATFAGGVMGSVIHWARSRRFAGSLLVGCAVGMITTVLYTVGVNVFAFTPIATAGEALAFALSAVGAVLGPSVLRTGHGAPQTGG